MVSIKDRKILRQMFSHYDYVMTTAQLSKEKLYYRDIQRMLGAGLIEKVKRGYYHWTMGSGKGDVVIISRLFPDGILCMETALFYYGYSDRNPAEWNIAIDKNTSRQRTRIDYPSVKAYRIEPTILSIGATRGEINFTDVRIYDRDRTICDVLRNMNKMDKELFNKAIQGYVNDPQKNVPNLIEYAKALRVCLMQKEKFILCPVCGNKTRVQIREDTELKNFPLFCPKCHKQTLINAKQLNITKAEVPDAKTQSR